MVNHLISLLDLVSGFCHLSVQEILDHSTGFGLQSELIATALVEINWLKQLLQAKVCPARLKLWSNFEALSRTFMQAILR